MSLSAAYRALGIDLQKKVHEDMTAHFASYPKLWGMSGTDTNIDHRRVPNLRVFFTRHGQSLPVSVRSRRLPAGRHRHMEFGKEMAACPISPSSAT